MDNQSDFVPADDLNTIPAEFEALLPAYKQAMRADRVELAETLAVNLLQRAGEWASQNPSPGLDLKEQARLCEARADWTGAEAAHRKCLVWAREQGSDHTEFKARLDLSSLLSLLGRWDESLAETQAALETARRIDSTALLLMALESIARIALRRGDVPIADSAAAEMLHQTDEAELFDLMRARALVLRARCALHQGEPMAASSDLAAAWNLLAPKAEARMMAGYQSALAAWWEATADQHIRQNNPAGAVAALREATAYRRRLAQLPHVARPYTANALANTLRHLARALLTVQDDEGAARCLAESHEIRQGLGLPLAPEDMEATS